MQGGKYSRDDSDDDDDSDDELAINFVKYFMPLNKELNLPPESNWIIPSHSGSGGEIRVHENGIVRQSNTVALTGIQ